jgi:hypothetical protein
MERLKLWQITNSDVGNAHLPKICVWWLAGLPSNREMGISSLQRCSDATQAADGFGRKSDAVEVGGEVIGSRKELS